MPIKHFVLHTFENSIMHLSVPKRLWICCGDWSVLKKKRKASWIWRFQNPFIFS